MATTQHQQSTTPADSSLPAGYQEVDAPSDFLNFAPGQEVRGLLSGTREINGQLRYTLRIGERDFVLPSHADLMRKLGVLTVGAPILIRRTHDEQSLKNGRTMFKYLVAVNPDAEVPF